MHAGCRAERDRRCFFAKVRTFVHTHTPTSSCSSSMSSHALLLPGEEVLVPPWKPRMPTDPDIQKQKTPEELLWEAAFDGDHETAAPIIEAGVDLDWRAVPRLGFFVPAESGHFGWAPFHLACCYNRSTKLVKMLIDAGCNVNVKNVRCHENGMGRLP